MDQATQIRLIEQTLKLHENKTTDMIDQEYHNPVDRYTDPARLELEMNMLLRRYPLIVAHSSEVPKPGDFKTDEIMGTPILLTRDREGKIKAFVNACRHRGTKLVWEEKGEKTRAFVCPYHAWTYSIDGKLVGVPRPEAFPSVCKETHSLAELHCEERQGLIFVQLSPDAPKMDIDAYMGEMLHDLKECDIADYAVYKSDTYIKNTNWKLAFDVFLENYHTPRTHTKTIWQVFLDNVAVYDRFSPHLRCLIPKRSILNAKGTDPQTDPEAWNLREHATMLYVMFPTTMMAVLVDHVAIFQSYPIGVDKCELRVFSLAPKALMNDEAARDEWDKSLYVVGKVLDEDSARSEAIQKTLLSGANKHFVFGRFEQELGWFHEEVEKAVSTEQGHWTSLAAE